MRLRRLSEQEWEDLLTGIEQPPVACDPAWAHAFEGDSSGRFRPIPWELSDRGGSRVVVGYEDRISKWPTLTLSPLGFGLAVTGVQSAGEASAVVRRLASLIGLRYRSVSFTLPAYLQKMRGDEVKGETSCTHTHVLKLDAPWVEIFESRMKGATRTCIRRSVKSDVVIEFDRSIDSINSYYKVHEGLARLKGGYDHLHSIEMMRDLVQRCSKCEFVTAKIGSTLVGGGVFFEDGPDLFYWHGAMDRAYTSSQPVYAMLATVIQRAIEDGRRAINFGGSRGIATLEAFKESWGAERVSLQTGVLRHPTVDRARTIWKGVKWRP